MKLERDVRVGHLLSKGNLLTYLLMYTMYSWVLSAYQRTKLYLRDFLVQRAKKSCIENGKEWTQYGILGVHHRRE